MYDNIFANERQRIWLLTNTDAVCRCSLKTTALIIRLVSRPKNFRRPTGLGLDIVLVWFHTLGYWQSVADLDGVHP